MTVAAPGLPVPSGDEGETVPIVVHPRRRGPAFAGARWTGSADARIDRADPPRVSGRLQNQKLVYLARPPPADIRNEPKNFISDETSCKNDRLERKGEMFFKHQ